MKRFKEWVRKVIYGPKQENILQSKEIIPREILSVDFRYDVKG